MGIKVYKASAGSGKTYTLVYEYIRFLFEHLFEHLVRDEKGEIRIVGRDMPSLNLHRRILAVTFTNKATAEMKERIVKGLYELSQGEHKEYLEKLRENVSELRGMADDDVAMCAKRLLTDILQDYAQFRVSTIDGFFQQVVRSFARELNLNNQYQVELDSDSILELAVDNMLASLGDEGCEMLLKWLTDFSTDRVGSEQSWNPRSAILQLSKLTMKESYVLHRDSFGFDLDVMEDYRNRLREIVKKFDSDLMVECEVAENVLKGVDGKEVFGDNRISRFNYEYLKGKDYEISVTFEKCAKDAELKTWCKKDYQKDTSLKNIVDQLYKCAEKIVNMCKGERMREYKTAKIVLSRLYVLGILSEIDNRVMEICRTRDCLMISSTTDFINKIIDNSDTPFIYEKVGVAIDNFMIDEFQDTSRLQWSNFVPLLSDAVAQGNESMIVGDVKQSIYRWRNGDWRILYDGVDKQFGDYVNHKPLGENYRSREEVVNFNNKLYEELPLLVDAQLQKQKIVDGKFLEDVYKDSTQKLGKERDDKGYVRVEFLSGESGDAEDLTWKDVSLNKMVATMRELNVFGDMAVLVRKNAEAQLVAKRLKEEGIPFYSSEALCVADNVAVRFVVAVLRYMMQPQEQLYRANMLALYRELCSGRMVGVEDYELMSYRDVDYAEWERCLFGDDIVAERFGRLRYLSLLQTIESLVTLFGLDNVDGGVHSIYLQSFMDKVQSYAIDGVLDIRSLLEYWEIEGAKSFIAMPEGGDAVKIVTIHKSKGLEFGIVFIPFMDWSLGLSGLSDIQLANTTNKSRESSLFIDKVPLVPIDMQASRKLFDSEFKAEIVAEFKALCLDVMNVLYVATTRASKHLYLYCAELPKKKEKKEKKESEEKDVKENMDKISITELLRRVLAIGDEDTMCEFGECVYVKSNKESDGIEKKELKRDAESLPTEEEVAKRAQLRFNYSEDECEGDMRRYGVMMHKLFEGIGVIDDIDDAIEGLKRNGEYVDGMSSEVDEIFAIDGVMELFDARWRVLNEAEIFDGKRNRVYRPDRVMIDDENGKVVVLDYKFGEYTEELHEKYSKQVGRYVRLIKEMGYDVQGCILYAKERKIIKI